MKALRGTELKRFLRAVDRPDVTVSALLQDVEDPVNVGSAFRIADAAGLARLVLTGITPTPPHKLIEKVGRGKPPRVPWRHEADVEAAIDAERAAGAHVVAVELTDAAVPYFAYDFPRHTCLVVGHEDHGVTKRALARVDGAVFIPMFGKGASLNVHVALGVVAFHVLAHHARLEVSARSDQDAAHVPPR